MHANYCPEVLRSTAVCAFDPCFLDVLKGDNKMVSKGDNKLGDNSSGVVLLASVP